ncbi:serine/threonine protein phosphatase [filamentous cyanobacterium CCP2]|nr:serine/threonine protein phosphatase [filamentous cyanobacterium CCP2]
MSRYLWAVGKSAEAFKPGDTLADRYLCQGLRIFLDVKPTVLPGNLDEVPEDFLPYLKLSPYQIHIPQVYDWVQPNPGTSDVVLLLDKAPLYTAREFERRGIRSQPNAASEAQIFPSIAEVWQTETPLRQLHWLWQIANLWQHMSDEGVASSLLYPELLRVEGPILRLLELRSDAGGTPSLSSLGEIWSGFAQAAKPPSQAPLQQICQQLLQGQIRTSEELVTVLDGVMGEVGRSQQTRTLHIATLSDKGPSRQRNEDACYPDGGERGAVTSSPPAAPLVIVCDGIGGHQGGDVASNMAIRSIEERILSLQTDRLTPTELSIELEKAVCAANDLISQQNDAEQRFDRQRMGTTVVMGLVRAHELYITHVGDSRAYWITRWGCHQITQDDDVASREVRLGYSTYFQALQQPSAGSLVQALGMASSTNLYPTVQRFILDEDGVFLLCSDGLSDNDRVEESWEEVILPLLNQGKDLATVSHELVKIGNTRNGYDNTTIGIIHCQVSGATSPAIVQPTTAAIPASTTVQLPTRPQTQRVDTAIFSPTTPQRSSNPVPLAASDAPTVIPKPSDFVQPDRDRSNNWGLLLGIIGLAGILAALGVVFFGQFDRLSVSQAPSSPENTPEPLGSPQASPNPAFSDPPSLEAGAVVRVNQTLDVQTVHPAENPDPAPENLATILEGSIVYVVNDRALSIPEQDGQENTTWLELAVCSSNALKQLGEGDELPNPNPNPVAEPESTTIDELPPAAPSPRLTPLKQGDNSWVRESTVRQPGFLSPSSQNDQRACDTVAQQRTPAPVPQSDSSPDEQPDTSPAPEAEPVLPGP